MSLKQAIKEAVNANSPRWKVKRVWPVVVEEPQTLDGHHTMLIEVSVAPRKKK